MTVTHQLQRWLQSIYWKDMKNPITQCSSFIFSLWDSLSLWSAKCSVLSSRKRSLTPSGPWLQFRRTSFSWACRMSQSLRPAHTEVHKTFSSSQRTFWRAALRIFLSRVYRISLNWAQSILVPSCSSPYRTIEAGSCSLVSPQGTEPKAKHAASKAQREQGMTNDHALPANTIWEAWSISR